MFKSELVVDPELEADLSDLPQVGEASNSLLGELHVPAKCQGSRH